MPSSDSTPDAASPSRSSGTPISERGSGRSSPRVQSREPADVGWTTSSPSSRARSTPSGRRLSIASAPTSTVTPATSASRSLPPTCGDPSSSSTSRSGSSATGTPRSGRRSRRRPRRRGTAAACSRVQSLRPHPPPLLTGSRALLGGCNGREVSGYPVSRVSRRPTNYAAAGSGTGSGATGAHSRRGRGRGSRAGAEAETRLISADDHVVGRDPPQRAVAERAPATPRSAGSAPRRRRRRSGRASSGRCSGSGCRTAPTTRRPAARRPRRRRRPGPHQRHEDAPRLSLCTSAATGNAAPAPPRRRVRNTGLRPTRSEIAPVIGTSTTPSAAPTMIPFSAHDLGSPEVGHDVGQQEHREQVEREALDEPRAHAEQQPLRLPAQQLAQRDRGDLLLLLHPLERRRLHHRQPDVGADREQQRCWPGSTPASPRRGTPRRAAAGERERPGREQQATGYADVREAAEEAAALRRGVLDREQYGAAVLAADADALQDPQHDQQRSGPRPRSRRTSAAARSRRCRRP